MPTTFSVQPSTTFPAPSDDRRVIVGDFDNDGDDDIVVQSGGNGSPFLYYQSNGDGTFTSVVLSSSPLAGLTLPDHDGENYYVADFDGDGDMDIWAAGAGTTGSYFRNDGGVFSAQSSATFALSSSTAKHAVGDFDGDGDADILTQTGGALSPFVYYQSNGDGTFTALSQASSPFAGLTLPANSGGRYLAADYDGDGDIDLWVSSALGVGSYFQNDGGTFSAQVKVGLVTAQIASRVSVADFDSDGDADVLAQVLGNLSLFSYTRSNGDGTFTLQTQGASPFGGVSLPDNDDGTYHLGDFDGDGDIDIWVANGGVNGTFLMQDGAPPALALTINAGTTADAELALTFTETVSKGDGDLYLIRLSDNTIIATVDVASAQVTGSGADWSADFNVAVEPGQSYAVQFDAGAFVDGDGAIIQAGAGGPGSVFSVPADARDDAFAGQEDLTVSGDLLADNGMGADLGVSAVTEVNGSAAAVGAQITLASGALLTVNADGTFAYDPNGAFDALAGQTSGASNLSAIDSFTYRVDGGDMATVTLTIAGQDTADVAQGTNGGDVIRAGLLGDTVNGFDGNDTLYGEDGDDILNGGAGADKLYGEAGADTLNGGDGADTLVGGDGDDIINGGAGNDLMTGGAGVDIMNGGTGNDVYVVLDADDVVNEAANEGYDIVRSHLSSYTLGANVEGLQLQGTDDIDGVGNSLSNNIQGNAGANRLEGGAGVDTILGGDGDDVIIGGVGNDLMTGGAGADRFVMLDESMSRPVLEVDRIYDLTFADGDRLDLSGIDANTLVAGDQAFSFVSAATTGAGEAVLTYDPLTGYSLLRLYVDGQGGEDYQVQIFGDVTGGVVLTGTEPPEQGGWLL